MSETPSDAAESQTPAPAPQMLNVPNALSMSRLILACVVFALIEFDWFLAAFILFVIAASTDWVDGWWARKFNQVTQLGRMLDPFVDKIIICGTFIFLSAEYDQGSGIAAWMTTIVVGRELLVTALRSMIEASGGDFSAGMSGKLKMVFQCVAVGASLITLSYGVDAAPAWLTTTLFISAIVAVISTVQSGIGYVFAAIRMTQAKESPAT